MLDFVKDNKSIEEIRNTNKGAGILKELISAFGVFLCGEIVYSIPATIIGIIIIVIYGLVIGNIQTAFNSEQFDIYTTIVALICQIFGIFFVFIWAEKRHNFSIRKTFFSKRNYKQKYMKFMGIGLLLFSLVVFIGYILGQYKFAAVSEHSQYFLIFMFFVGFLFQGAFEEIFCRGYLLPILARKHSTTTAIIISSLFFSIMHAFNGGFSILPCLNLFVYGIFMALYMLKYNDLWGACAIHSIWNFAQGCIFGFNVSGTFLLPSILRFEMAGSSFLAGGDFGPEGGLITTIVLLAGILIMLILPNKETKIAG